MIDIKLIDYGNGLHELREYYKKELQEQSDLTDFIIIDKDFCVNKKTGEAKERKQPTNKAEVKSIQRTMLKEFRLLLYNINKALPDGKVYYITMTNRSMLTYDEFNQNLDKFVHNLKYANSKITENDFKYAFVKEANSKGRFHIHGFIWYTSDEKLQLSEEIINDKWCYGTGKIEQITTSEDLLKVLFYVTNYSNKDRSNKKVKRKKEGLKFFPNNTHLVCRTKNLEEPPYKEVEDFFVDNDMKISQSTRNQKNFYFDSIFYKEK